MAKKEDKKQTSCKSKVELQVASSKHPPELRVNGRVASVVWALQLRIDDGLATGAIMAIKEKTKNHTSCESKVEL